MAWWLRRGRQPPMASPALLQPVGSRSLPKGGWGGLGFRSGGFGGGSTVLVSGARGSGAARWPWPCGQHGGWGASIGGGGPMPEAVAHLSMLEVLNLELASCEYLEMIDLGENYFEGIVPTGLSKLSHFQILLLGYNNIVGPIPTALSNLTSLTYLDLSDRNLTGEIPQELGLMRELLFLSLGSNQLIGEIPDSFGNLSKLFVLILANSQLSGQVPITLGENAALNKLILSVTIWRRI
ncbi:uncharacterized protein [Aegilops tauschii subsp. strangulata]|uniref:LRR receptor-like serine/threonine-protein kinase RCH1 n=1 Tax=Aegilops tauschii TaxID=37682 RepID=N1QSZ7_AEGTA